ncbi:5',5'''-P-1,P-4-tetraphosphate phosphorylase [Scheffersomyces coipomensis]|uniref:5',5'''-P-1,P-4-tetraphosphate phosphorylase n=1 Tax=Scheffersomyces coipomensis TaxID=1788519 RepID=UPI00315DA7A8
MSSTGYDLPHDFYQQLTLKYNEAITNGHIKFNGESKEEELIHNENIDVVLTLLHSLQFRPEQGTKETNPFAKPEPELTIIDNYGNNNEFRIIFNKFPVIANHFMIVTQKFKSQLTPLSLSELKATYKTLTALKVSASEDDWFAFYNSGPQSGASQPHKHIQFMTLPHQKGFKVFAESLADTSESFIPNAKRDPLQNPNLPFAHYVVKLPNVIDDLDDLALYFGSLIQSTLNTLRQNDSHDISYNFVMTTKYMLMVPRSNGKYKDKLGINSCGIIGLILCKDDELLQLVKNDGPLAILEAIGYPNTHGQSSDEYNY